MFIGLEIIGLKNLQLSTKISLTWKQYKIAYTATFNVNAKTQTLIGRRIYALLTAITDLHEWALNDYFDDAVFLYW